ncbi:PAS domain S-box protein [Candidatus Bathyarchaeota archaeon]|nr:PAS domain S-box protein [Candidatus Bathyarchaeota archaeon]
MLKGETVQSSTQGVSPAKISRVEEKNRKTGIDVVGDAPFGTHFCLFYETKDDLIDVLVPYFKAGLESNEFCMWVTSEPLSEEEAKEAMRRAVPNFDGYVERGQIEIVPYTEWYLKGGAFNLQRVLNGWVEKLNHALAKGYDGMRLTGNTAWLEKRDWRNFVDYEQEINRVIGKYRMIALCTYSLDKCVASEILDVVRNHQFAVIKREGKWELIESSELKRTEASLRETEEKYKELTESISDVFFAMDKDFRYTYWNKASEKLTGISAKDAVGKSLTEVFPDVKGTIIEQFYKEALRTQKPQSYLNKYQVGGKDYVFEINTYPTETGLSVFVKDITERKKAEETLLKSETKYRELVEVLNEGIWVIDKDAYTTFVNPRMAEILGYTVDEMQGKHLFSFMDEKGVEIAKHLLGRRKQGVEEQHDFEFVRKDGKRVYAVLETTPLTDENGNYRGAIAGVMNVTERRKTEKALRESDEKLRNVFAASPDAITVTNLNGIIVDCNQATVDLHGYQSREGVIGKNAFVFIAKKDHEKAMQNLKKTLEHGSVKNLEYTCLTKDGREFPAELSASAVRDASGKPEYFVAITKDVTNRKQAEEELAVSEKKFRTIFEGARDGILAADAETKKFVFANPMICEITGYSEQELLRLSVEDMHSEKDLPYVMEAFSKQLQRKIEIAKDVPVLRKDRTVVYCDVNSYLLEIGERKLIVGLFRDATERNKMEAQLKEYSEHLEEKVEERTNQLKEAQEQLLKAEKLAAIGEVAAMVGHDLRNPLQVITNTLYTSEKKSESIPITEKEILEKHGFLDLRSGLKEQVEYMEKIVSDLQNYARPLKPKPVEIGLHQLINKTLSSLTVPENVKVSIVIEKDFPKLMLDPALMQRVFSNLITNALQAMPNGGKLTIRASKKEETTLISIEDTGAGIPDENLSKLFTPLFTTKAKGQGFGLPVCKRMVEAHDGNITVESKVGKGSTFTIKIPLRKEVS